MRFLIAALVVAAAWLSACDSPDDRLVDDLLRLTVETGSCNYEHPADPRYGTADCTLSMAFADDAEIAVTRVDHGVPYMRFISPVEGFGPEERYDTWFRSRYGADADGRGKMVGFASRPPPARTGVSI